MDNLTDWRYWVTILFCVSVVFAIPYAIMRIACEYHYSRWRHLEDRSLGE